MFFLKLLLVLHEPDGGTESGLVGGVGNLDDGAVTHWVPAREGKGQKGNAGQLGAAVCHYGVWDATDTYKNKKKTLITYVYGHMYRSVYVIF